MTTQEFTSSTNPVRILVVDDHPNTATTLARALSQLGAGVSVISASSGNDALEKVKTTGVDILFTDMIMPEMTGLELIEKMQKHPAGRPSYTYLVTAYDVPGLKVTAQRLKVNEVIVKPVRPERICQIAVSAIEEMKQMKHMTQPIKQVTARKKKFKILVADDRPDNVTLLTRYLEYEGYACVTARDGLETLDKIRDELPDLVLLDVDMPHKDGFTVLQEIREDPSVSYIPVIILTAARLDPSDIQSGLNLGADDYVTKPFDRHELMARIRTKLRVKEAEDIIRRRNRELGILPEIGRELSARLNINELIAVVLRRSVETLGAISGYVLITNSGGGAPVKKSYSASDVEMDFPTLDRFLENIQESHQGLVISDTSKDERWQAGQVNLLHSAVIAPMFGRNALLGLLVLAHEDENYFGPEHLLLLQAISGQAAIALENARLYADVAKEQQRLSAVLQSAANAILMFDGDDCLKLVNPAGEKLFTDFETKLNMPLARKSGYDGLIDLLEQVNVSKKSKTGELAWPDKRTFTILMTPIEGGGCVAVLQDVTHFKDVDRIKNEFIATASHDLKNPLTSVLGYCQMLLQSGPLTDMQTDFVHRIQHSGKNMHELVQNMLSLAQVDLKATQKYAPVEMGTLLATVVDEFSLQAGAKEQAFNFTLLKGNIQINGDLLQLKQVFRNLVGNAIKYTPQGGKIALTMKIEKENMRVDVQDTGFGIPAADLPFIFDRFYRVREGKNSEMEGNGLGLAIVKSITEQHGGQIHVESEVDKGTRFSVALPLLSVK